ncbi:serine/threonine-protein kinase 33 isoform X2 [Mastacembelus armatus]|uniref:serine/threonine-protein kinase 33 isoform X2 n=1 Tax=Mastacembelus armatus TaxID=205130 RepID=UPI000E460783|nr:serine/threonine-protein kinase 33 isoform X2 [Mastacembelus armatus]
MDMVSICTTRDTLERDLPIMCLENDAELLEIYQFGRKLGKGSFGVVFEATHIETQTQWAIKVVRRPAAGNSRVKLLEQEINILKQVNHAYIIHLKEIYNSAHKVYLVTELCTGGDLKQMLQKKKFFTEDQTRHVICSLADAIAYLHKRDIVHRDLKLENILVKNPPDKKVDGRINIKTHGVGILNIMMDICGTLHYMAPEMLSNRGYSHWCDVWSIGVVMYMLLCGEPPFVSTNKETLLEEIMNKEVTFTQPIWTTVSDAAKSLLTCLLKEDPAYRMSANQLLENPWITGDTNVPAVPVNVLEMMREHLELQDRTQTQEDLCLTSSEDTSDPHLAPRAASAETNGNCRSPAKLSPERDKRDSSFCTSPTSTKLTKVIGGSLQQNKCRNGSQTPGLFPLRQAHVGKQLSANQHRPQDRKDFSAGQKPASDLRKTDNQRPSTSRKSRTGSRKPSASLIPLQNKTKK